MRILFLGNNRVGLETLRYLQMQGEELVGLVLHPEEMRKCGPELIETASVPGDALFQAKSLRDPDVLERIRDLKADIAVSVFFGFILKPEFINIFPQGVINLHPAYLPWNRGGYPNVWSIIDGTPAGATLHYIDPGVDTGDIILQREVEISPTDTGESLYDKLEHCCVDVFKAGWPMIHSGNAPRAPQDPSEGTSHRDRDVETVDQIDLDKQYTGRDLINLLRARTFPPHAGAWFEENGKKVYLRLQLLTKEQLEAEQSIGGMGKDGEPSRREEKHA
ncbi:formyl transferase [bacterium]|nr:formyl transferase [bacterium]